MIKLEIKENGIIQAYLHLKPKNSQTMEMILFRLDTGANRTTISKEDLKELGYDLPWIQQNAVRRMGKYCETADGALHPSYSVPIPVLNLWGLEGKNFPMGVLEDVKIEPPHSYCTNCPLVGVKRKDFNNLLGMDLLSCFSIQINPMEGFAYLELLKDLPKITKEFEGQSLNYVGTVSALNHSPGGGVSTGGGAERGISLSSVREVSNVIDTALRDLQLFEVLQTVYKGNITQENFNRLMGCIPTEQYKDSPLVPFAVYCCKTLAPMLLKKEPITEEKVVEAVKHVLAIYNKRR